MLKMCEASTDDLIIGRCFFCFLLLIMDFFILLSSLSEYQKLMKGCLRQRFYVIMMAGKSEG